MTGRVHVVMPAGVRDAERPSGGNAYDVRVCAGLAVRGWSVIEHLVPGTWPEPDEAALARLDRVLASVPAGDAALVDGLVGSTAPETVVAQGNRLRLGVLVHMPLSQALEASADVRARERGALTAAGVVLVTSEWTGRWLRDAYRVDPARIRVAVPGADPAPVAAGSTTGRRLLVVGPVSHAKGHDTLMAALDRLRHLEWQLDAVGSPSVDADTAAAFFTWAAARNRVHVRGPLAGAELRGAYASADLLVHPSRSETYGMVLTEALARGIPVLASDVGGTREAVGVVDGLGRPGLLVPAGDVDALTAALSTWLTDADLRRRLREAALVRRDRLPSWADTVSVVDEALRSDVLAGAPR